MAAKHLLQILPLAILCLICGCAGCSRGCDKTPKALPTGTAQTPQTKAAAGYPSMRVVTSIEQALTTVLSSKPAVIGIGEYHQTKKTAGTPSALKRFTGTMLGILAKRGHHHLVVETWITTGSCGASEQQATQEITDTTQRPETTENEIELLLSKARDLDVQPHILTIECQDYQKLFASQQVDYGQLLTMTGRKLNQTISQLLLPSTGSIAVYGGAIHNDLKPSPDSQQYAYGPAINTKTKGRYTELDLVVPAFVDPEIIRELDWYPLLEPAQKTKQLVLIKRSAQSWVLVFPE